MRAAVLSLALMLVPFWQWEVLSCEPGSQSQMNVPQMQGPHVTHMAGSSGPMPGMGCNCHHSYSHMSSSMAYTNMPSGPTHGMMVAGYAPQFPTSGMMVAGYAPLPSSNNMISSGFTPASRMGCNCHHSYSHMSSQTAYPGMQSGPTSGMMSAGYAPLPSSNSMMSAGYAPLPSSNSMMSAGYAPLPSSNSMMSAGFTPASGIGCNCHHSHFHMSSQTAYPGMLSGPTSGMMVASYAPLLSSNSMMSAGYAPLPSSNSMMSASYAPLPSSNSMMSASYAPQFPTSGMMVASYAPPLSSNSMMSAGYAPLPSSNSMMSAGFAPQFPTSGMIGRQLCSAVVIEQHDVPGYAPLPSSNSHDVRWVRTGTADVQSDRSTRDNLPDAAVTLIWLRATGLHKRHRQRIAATIDSDLQRPVPDHAAGVQRHFSLCFTELLPATLPAPAAGSAAPAATASGAATPAVSASHAAAAAIRPGTTAVRLANSSGTAARLPAADGVSDSATRDAEMSLSSEDSKPSAHVRLR